MRHIFLFLSFFCIISLCFISFTSNNIVSGLHAGYIYTEDFEDHANNEDASEGGWFWSEELRSKFACDGSGNFDVYRAWDGGGLPPNGHFYYSYEYDLNIKNISFIVSQATNQDQPFTWYFNDSADNTFFRTAIFRNGNDMRIGVWDWTTSLVDYIHTGLGDGVGDSKITFTFNDQNITVNITNSVFPSGREYACTITGNQRVNTNYDYNLTRLEDLFMIMNPYHEHFLIDEMSVLFRTLIGAELPFDTTGMIQIGDYLQGDVTDYIAVGGAVSYIEIERDVKMSATIHHVALKVLVSWYQLWGGTEDDLKLMLNGEDMGKPDGHILIDPSSHLFYWKDIDKDIIDENPLFEFRCTNDGFNWYVPEVTEDIDDDSDVEYSYHPFSSMFQGIYDNTASGDLHVVTKDIVYCFWYDSLTPPYEEEYIYWINCIPDGVKQYESIYCLYTCPIDANVNIRIHDPFNTLIYDKSAEFTGLQTGQIIFTPIVGGFLGYNFSLYSVDNSTTMAYEVVSVTNYTTDYLIFTRPNPSKPSSKFDLYYIYNASTFDGTIKIIRLQDGITYFEESIEKNTNDVTKISDISLPYEGIYECKLYISTATSDLIKYNYQHLCQEEHTNTIYIGLKNSAGQWSYYKDYTAFGFGADISFVGSHNFMLQDIYIQILSDKIGVSAWWSFSEPVPQHILDIADGGEYTAYLKLNVNGTIITLSSYSFSIGASGIEGDEDRILPSVERSLGAFLGIAITVVFTLIPILVQIPLKSDIFIPPLVYAIFTCLGIVLSIYLGFFDIWVVFFIIVISIVMTLLLYLRGD